MSGSASLGCIWVWSWIGELRSRWQCGYLLSGSPPASCVLSCPCACGQLLPFALLGVIHPAWRAELRCCLVIVTHCCNAVMRCRWSHKSSLLRNRYFQKANRPNSALQCTIQPPGWSLFPSWYKQDASCCELGVAAGRNFSVKVFCVCSLFCFRFPLICYPACKSPSLGLSDQGPALGPGRGVPGWERDWQRLQRGVMQGVESKGFWYLSLAANPECVTTLTKEMSGVGDMLKEAWTIFQFGL